MSGKDKAPPTPPATNGNGATHQQAQTPASGASEVSKGIAMGMAASPHVAGLAHPPQTAAGAPVKPTVAHMMGEMVWLMSQSPVHKHYAIADLEWMIMPPLLLEQYRVFRDKDRPIGVALWAYLSEEAERKLTEGVVRLHPKDWKSGDRLWLVEIIAPFHTADNRMVERMLVDLQSTSLKGKKFKFRSITPVRTET